MDHFVIAAGSDHAGINLKCILVDYMKTKGISVIDVGCHSTDSVDYPCYAKDVCDKILQNEAKLGLLVCGSGIGMSIAANKFPGIRCALCHDYFTARNCRNKDDCNILALGERTIGVDVAKQMLDVFLTTQFNETTPQYLRRRDLIETIINN